MDKKGVGFVLLLVFLGIFGGMGFVPTYQHNIAVQENQPTTAEITSHDIEVRESDDDTDYVPVITYTYTVNGETYTDDNLYPGRFTRTKGSRSSAQSMLDNYPLGEEFTVHYNPENHGQAYLRRGGWPSLWWLGVAYAGVTVVGGVWLIRVGFRRRKQRALMEDTPTEQVQSLSIGPSEIKGKAVTAELEPGPAPFSNEKSVVAKYEIREYDDDSDDDGGSWQTIEEDVLHKPFYLDDGTGSVLIRPDDETIFDLDPDDWSETYVDSSNRGPEPIQEFVEGHDDISFPKNAGGKDNDRKYRQNLIKDGESAYVFGTVHPRETDQIERGAANEDRVAVQKTAEDSSLSEPMYMISDDSEKSLTNRREWALWRLPVGVVFLTVALVIGLLMAGPMLGIPLPVLL
jgi:hypothetical protein